MTYKKRRIATIDLGTNSLLMLIAERDEAGVLRILRDRLETPRIGENLRETGKISGAALERACEVLRTFVSDAKEAQVESIHATATSAVREASNQSEAIERLNAALSGSSLEIIAPNEEARLTYISVTSEEGHEDPSMVVDIGGGSTEITWGLGPRFDGGRSLKVGTVKLFEGPLRSSDRPSVDLLETTRSEIDGYLSRIPPLGSFNHYYGTAGSFTHLASLSLQLPTYSSRAVHAYVLSAKDNASWLEKLCLMSAEERRQLPGVDHRRADLLIPGCVIIERLFKKFGNDSFSVIDRGIRYGKLFDVLKGFTPPVLFSD